MLRAALVRVPFPRRIVLSRRAAALTSTAIVGGGVVWHCGSSTTKTTTTSLAGLRRQAQFWSRVGPVVLDYYWKTASSSPRVRFLDWWNTQQQQPTKQDVLQQLHEQHAPEIADALLELKGLYIKLGQVLSVTILPIPEAYRQRFRTFQSNVPGWQDFDTVIRPVLEAELLLTRSDASSLDDLFESIDPIPCGAASIGQAHRAVLKETGDEVILKVQYPDAAWQVPADIACVGDFLKLCVWFGVVDGSASQLSFDEFARQFVTELDYQQERSNLETIYESSLENDAYAFQEVQVVVPNVYPELCTDKVIAMRYLPGPTLEEEAKRQLAVLGIDTTKRGGVARLIRNAAKDSVPENNGDTERRQEMGTETASSSSSLTTRVAQIVLGALGRGGVGVDTLLWLTRWVQRVALWSQAAAVAVVDASPTALVPASWKEWADDHTSAARQAAQLNVTQDWMEALFQVLGHQIFDLGLFHADPHPGNILVVQDEEEDGGQPSNKLGLIDFGQCKQLTQQEQVLIAQLILSVVDEDHNSNDKVATAFRNLGIVTQNDSTEFLAELARLMLGSLQPRHLNHSWHKRLHELDHVTYFPKELSMVYRTSLLLRGLGVSLQMNYGVAEQWKVYAQACVDRHPELAEQLTLSREQSTNVVETWALQDMENEERGIRNNNTASATVVAAAVSDPNQQPTAAMLQ